MAQSYPHLLPAQLALHQQRLLYSRYKAATTSVAGEEAGAASHVLAELQRLAGAGKGDWREAGKNVNGAGQGGMWW